MQEFEEFMDYQETADFLGFSKSKLVAWVGKGSFPDAIRTKNKDFMGWTKSQIIDWQQSLIKNAV